ncbi:MAG: SDR family oxidoreductase [Actinomycetota bacterium]
MPVHVVTGASSGIGKETARALARTGATVAIVCRNPDKGRGTLAELQASAPNGRIDLLMADLAELAQVRALATELHDRYEGIDVLVNNAGINNTTMKTTTDGFDQMLATNYLAPFLLTNLITDLLQRGAPARVVNVASEAHRFALRPNFDRLPDLGSYGPFAANWAYGLTKLLLIFFTQELAERLHGTGVAVNAVCPGLVATNLAGDTSILTRIGNAATWSPFVRTSDQGAQISIKMAVDPEMAGVNGRFFTSTGPAKVLPTVRYLKDAELQRSLWERTSGWVGL